MVTPGPVLDAISRMFCGQAMPPWTAPAQRQVRQRPQVCLRRGEVPGDGRDSSAPAAGASEVQAGQSHCPGALRGPRVHRPGEPEVATWALAVGQPFRDREGRRQGRLHRANSKRTFTPARS